MWSLVCCRPPVGGPPGPINVVVGGGAGASVAGAAHSQTLSPLRSDTEFSRFVIVTLCNLYFSSYCRVSYVLIVNL